jgi:hypothetical protein
MLRKLQSTVEAHVADLNQHLELIRYKVSYYSELLPTNSANDVAITPELKPRSSFPQTVAKD